MTTFKKETLLSCLISPWFFFTKPSIFPHEEAIGSLYLTAAEASELANSGAAVNWGTHTELRETISLCVTSYVSHQSGAHFYGPGNGGPWWSRQRALADPNTDCTHIVSLSAGRCFLHRVEIWGVYYSTSWRFPHSLQIPPLWRLLSPSFCPRRVDGCSTECVRERCPWHSEPLVSRGVQDVCPCSAPASSSTVGSHPASSSLAPQPRLSLYCSKVSSPARHGSEFLPGPVSLMDVFKEQLFETRNCVVLEDCYLLSHRKSLYEDSLKIFFDSVLERTGPFLRPWLLVIVLNFVSVSLPAELCALFTGCQEDFVTHLYSKLLIRGVFIQFI